MRTSNILLTILICIFILLTLSIHAQEKERITMTALGFSLNPEMNTLITGNPIGIEKSTSKMGLSLGFDLEWKISEKSFFRSGIGFGIKKFEHTHSDIVFGSDIDSTGKVYKSRMESKISFNELQLPLIFHFQLNETKLFASVGVSITYPISNTAQRTVYHGNGSIEKWNGVNRNILNFAPQLSIGYNFPVYEKLSLSLEALIKYYTKAFIVPESNLINYGVKVGLNFGL